MDTRRQADTRSIGDVLPQFWSKSIIGDFANRGFLSLPCQPIKLPALSGLLRKYGAKSPKETKRQHSQYFVEAQRIGIRTPGEGACKKRISQTETEKSEATACQKLPVITHLNKYRKPAEN